MSKRDNRIITMQIIYSAEMSEVTIGQALIDTEIELNDEIKDLVKYVEENLEKIDEIISKSLVNYTINRLNLVDKAIVRVATAEMLLKTADKRIIINEALEITKEYSDAGDHKAVSFNNKLLDTISKNI